MVDGLDNVGKSTLIKTENITSLLNSITGEYYKERIVFLVLKSHEDPSEKQILKESIKTFILFENGNDINGLQLYNEDGVISGLITINNMSLRLTFLADETIIADAYGTPDPHEYNVGRTTVKNAIKIFQKITRPNYRYLLNPYQV